MSKIISKIDLWKYVKGDEFSLDDLADYKKFFEKDLDYALTALDKVERFRKYGIPGFRWMLIHAEAEVEESLGNLSIVDQAIEDTKERLGV